jgi:hypothetical protein
MGISNNPQVLVTHFVQPSTCRLKHHLQVCNLLSSLTLHKLSCDSPSNNLFLYNLSFLTSFWQQSFFWLEISNWFLLITVYKTFRTPAWLLQLGCVRFKATRGMEPRLSCEADWKQTFGMSIEWCADNKWPSRWFSYSTCDTISKELTLCLCPRFCQKSEALFCTDFWKWGKEISKLQSVLKKKFPHDVTFARSAKTRPRCSKFWNSSKLAHAGLSRTVSPASWCNHCFSNKGKQKRLKPNNEWLIIAPIG